MQKTMVFVFGTRPELIKMLPLVLAARQNPNIKAIACSTGQHKDMLEPLYSFFSLQPDTDFKLMKPNQNLVGLHAETMAEMNKLILAVKPDWVVVQGDTASAHAAGMTAFYNKIPVAHVEAGLRTYDIHSPFPEEMNRRAIGLIAKAHLCPTTEAAANLKNEKIDISSFIEITGNTGIDTLKIAAERIESSADLQEHFKKEFSYLQNKKFILATMHRRENFGDAQKEILKAFLEVVKTRQISILFPVHPNPNVRQSVEDIFQNEIGKKVVWVNSESQIPADNEARIYLIQPLDYPAMVYMMKRCEFLMTDSGGLQEEAPSFGKKILVLRNSTERPEGVSAGFSELVGTDYAKIIQRAYNLIDHPQHWAEHKIPVNPYGDGKSAERILEILLKN